MTETEVLERVERIRALAEDEQLAHEAEDRLRCEVLHAIAFGSCDDPRACARAALTTADNEFQRWYA